MMSVLVRTCSRAVAELPSPVTGWSVSSTRSLPASVRSYQRDRLGGAPRSPVGAVLGPGGAGCAENSSTAAKSVTEVEIRQKDHVVKMAGASLGGAAAVHSRRAQSIHGPGGRRVRVKCDGQPADDPDHARLPGRLVTIASRAATGVYGAVSSVNGIVTIAIIVIVWALFALHKLAILSAVSSTP